MVWVYLNRRIFNVKTLITLMRAFSPRNASLSLAHARDLLSQPLWRCQKTFRTTNELEFIKAAPKRLRQQVSPKAKQRRAARASARISVICVFSHLPTANRRNPHNKFEPVSSLFIPSQNQYYNQRRESRQEKPLLSLTRFFCLLLSPPKRRKPT